MWQLARVISKCELVRAFNTYFIGVTHANFIYVTTFMVMLFRTF